MQAHECVSFIMLNGSKVLLEKRSEHKETDPGLITIPGGHMERGESSVQAMLREVKEELNVTPTTYQYLCSLYHPTEELQLIHYFIVSGWDGEIRPYEAEGIEWCTLESAVVEIAADEVALNELRRLAPHLKF
ncbi:NUDIX domain-containing protein [Vibrio europaeus]|uniref:8-oxo-dGTP diphosphatase n=1 Tax=Vibrio europaeus TaxID=300876 RepID=A0A178JAL9_9VIBR|nr:NUDIX domain-containing protein [Vibrio europaeus]MDC5704767.1 NUDIX domain-containing protein [Vibrio europaeus]MDC5710046.1 NUDIX domain-containing protein [Vibrio europaeus]MDC5715136.1 NUDIX domain-containing protein [Vibrio europaeus]MDC5719010.1 NUDIX domain-containing protein [Vibrio europaeus]MDC5724815.1 NUDIX domain-containing protein [Vibrio europaeus]